MKLGSIIIILFFLFSDIPRLKVEDFKGTPPPGAYQDAYTECDYGYVLDNGRPKIPIQVYCTFKMDKSWIKPEHIKAANSDVTKYILVHEEGHFKNSIIAAKKLQKSVNSIDYKHPNPAVKKIENFRHLIDSEMNAQNDRYESKTRNGRDKEMQRNWNGYLYRQLDSLNKIKILIQFK